VLLPTADNVEGVPVEDHCARPEESSELDATLQLCLALRADELSDVASHL